MPESAVPSTSVGRLYTRLRGLTAWHIARPCLLALAFWGSLFASDRVGRASLQRDALWQVVSQLCVEGQRNSGTPFPCSSVNLQMGYAVLPITRTHILLVPTVPIHGIESLALIAPDSPNYWEIAWDQRSRLGQAIGAKVSRDDVALAVNSLQARTQDQLHIHISCIRPDVRSALKRYEADIGEGWSRLPFAIAGIFTGSGASMAIRLTPIRLNCWRRDCRRRQRDMASQTLVVVGATFRDGQNGFYLLTRPSTVHKPAEGELLLDYHCASLRKTN